MLQPGTLLDDKYQIEAVIGQGGFGFVYRARERLTGEIVAIKELVPSYVRDQQMVRRFILEARATLRLTHPHIARTHTIFADRGTYYLSMEYLAGGSLADRLERGPLAVEEAVRIARHVCQALAYAHREGVVHCDIKPANVLFDARGRTRLADFGIAHVSADLMTRHFFTSAGVAMGTVRYMAPEQLEGVRDDPRLDVYAVGAVLYEMLAGRPYLDFEEETTPAAQMRNMQRIQSTPPVPLRALNPSVPEAVAEAVGLALRKSPEQRFGSVEELEEALQARVPPMTRPRQAQRPLPPTRAMPTGREGARERRQELSPRSRRAKPDGAAAPSPVGRASVSEATPPQSAQVEPPLPSDLRKGARVSDASAPRSRRAVAWPPIDPDVLGRLRRRVVAYWKLVPGWTFALVGLALFLLMVVAAGAMGAFAGIGRTPARGPTAAFVSTRSGKREIYRLTSDGVEQVTRTGDGESWSPALAPGGTLHFTSNRDGRREVYRLTSAGVERVTRTGGGESWSPTVGPAGALYFTSDRDGKREIYRLTAKGVERVTRTERGESWSAALGPRGTLYFTSDRDGRREIYRLTTEGVERVTRTEPGESWSPALAANGTLYFTSDRSGKPEIYRLSSRAEVEQVTYTPGGEASWLSGLE